MGLKNDSRRAVPAWLERLDIANFKAAVFPLSDALEHSLYYPAAGFDGRPVQFLAGFIHSFIYVDYGNEERAVDDEVRENGFDGYHLSASKSLTETDLAPNGWVPIVPPEYFEQQIKFNGMRTGGWVKSPFATWYIFDRDENRTEDHGPQRFSLVYLCADGVAAYQALYGQNSTAPEVLAIIQPGTGFGGNYTDFRDPEDFFAWTVLRRDSQHTPEYLVCGEIGPLDRTEAFWLVEYPEHVEWFQRVHGNGVWRRRQR